MAKSNYRILIVENDAIIRDMIAREALQAAGFITHEAVDAGSAMEILDRFKPDVIMVDLSLPGLSGKDFLVALHSQNVEAPVVVIGRGGGDHDIIHAFRLGAADYLIWPMRPTEIIAVIERALRQVRAKREREQLSRQLKEANSALNQRVRELTTIFSIGKAVTSVTDQQLLFEKILEDTVAVTNADLGWFLLREEDSPKKEFILKAYKNLPESLHHRLNQPWEDEVISLIAMSGESLMIHGEPLQKFKMALLGKSILIVPIRVHMQVIGILALMRHEESPFTASDQYVCEAVADYASISLVNAQLFRTVQRRVAYLEKKAALAQVREQSNRQILSQISQSFEPPMAAAEETLDHFAKEPKTRWTIELREFYTKLKTKFDDLNQIVGALKVSTPSPAVEQQSLVDLVQLCYQSITAYEYFGKLCDIKLVANTSLKSLPIRVDRDMIQAVINGLLRRAIICSRKEEKVVLTLETANGKAHVSVIDFGKGLSHAEVKHFFEQTTNGENARNTCFNGFGITTRLIKQIVLLHDGEIWVESDLDEGTTIHFTLPLKE
jgi:DNA-binding response OmpR family regulator/signal transduction histidine kinase